MAFRFVLLCASALLVQTACGGYVYPQQSSIAVGSQQFTEVDSFSSTNGLAYGSGLNRGQAYGPGILPAGNLGINNLGINNLGLSSGYGSSIISGPSSVLIEQQPTLLIEQQPSLLVAQQPAVLISTPQPAYFNVISGSPTYDSPCGVTVSSENKLSGAVDVIGTLPFYASTWFDGSMPSSGEGGLVFGAGNGAGILDAGCGVGLGGANGIAVQGVLGQTLAVNPAQFANNARW